MCEISRSNSVQAGTNFYLSTAKASGKPKFLFLARSWPGIFIWQKDNEKSTNINYRDMWYGT